MSIITETLPDSIVICGKKCKIHTDFKTWLRFSELINNGDYDEKKIAMLFGLIFFELPPNFIGGLEAMLDFYTHSNKQSAKKQSGTPQKSVFDFDFDGNLIYAAFMQQYKIDLCTADMHWWQFKALFDCLSDDTQFIKVVGFRSINLTDIKDKEQKKYYRKMKSIYALPDKRSEEQKEIELNEALSTLF